MWLTNGVDSKEQPNHKFAMRIPATMGHEVSGQIYKIGKDVGTSILYSVYYEWSQFVDVIGGKEQYPEVRFSLLLSPIPIFHVHTSSPLTELFSAQLDVNVEVARC